ncbi:bile salt-activated lipase-like [Sitophilus oryzae]|uniref:Bile salt-activated lipase-like n=1 Tax=Sitophilus oryzae TaxID=7048 RepID=A0A6J2XDL2_SITOR|nr:bile salt-activated lipase-like [Sitophilus oryzae]
MYFIKVFVLVITIFFASNATNGETEPLVTITQGALQGSISYDYNGSKFYSFLGVPYATSPNGTRRFKVAEAPVAWDGVKNATVEGNACPQYNALTNSVIGDEDCLFLNVFTRNLPEENTKAKDVMVWIHGGSFTSGSGGPSTYGPEFLLTEDIVLVTINYRLGFFGYLQASTVPGNLGFKDQVAALKWVRDNIAQFNGDPDRVTLFGESAGSASVHYHVLSPLSKGLFHKAIMESGAALCSFADNSYHNIVALANSVDNNIKTEDEAVDLFTTHSATEFVQLQVVLSDTGIPGGPSVIGLSIENPADDAFISRNVIDILTSGEYNQVPLLLGFNDREGIWLEVIRESNNKSIPAEDFIPHNIDFGGNTTLKDLYVRKYQKRYFQTFNMRDGYIKAFGETRYLSGIFAAVKNHLLTAVNPVFLYKFAKDTSLNLDKVSTGVTDIPGASHGDEIGYLFYTPYTPKIKPESLEDISWREMVKLWTNFAKYGTPTPCEDEVGIIWKPATLDGFDLLHLQNTGLRMKANTEEELIKFWSELYHQSNKTINYLGLFQKAIMESGAALCSFADYSYHNIVALANSVNNNITTEDEAVDLFSTLSATELVQLQVILSATEKPGGPNVMGLKIEDPANDAFISRNVIDILTSGEYNQIPLLLGFNDREGILFELIREYSNKSIPVEDFIPHNIDFGGNTILKDAYVKKYQERYFQAFDRDSYIKAFSDTRYIPGIFGTVKNHLLSSVQPVFLYKFSRDTSLNYAKVTAGARDIPGASHADDIGYLFYTPYTPEIVTGSVEDISWRQMVKLWTNFAKYDNPTPSEDDVNVIWSPATLNEFNLLHFQNSGLSVEANAEEELIEFWSDLYHQSNNTINYL